MTPKIDSAADSGQKTNSKDVDISGWPIFSLWALAIAQPLLEQLAGSPEFFIVKRSQPMDIILFPIILLLLFPGLLVGFIKLVAQGPLVVARVLHRVILFLLVGAFVLIGLVRILPFSGVVVIAIAAVLSALMATGYVRYPSVRTAFRYMGIFVLLVPVLFFSRPSIQRLIFAQSYLLPNIEVSSKTPVVMVIFDELPLQSLVNKKGEIDSDLYPTFAELARHSHWFRNATTVSAVTTEAVPAILSGKYPKDGLIPAFYDYPKNLFTLLAKSHELVVYESATHLCPEDMPLNKNYRRLNFPQRMWFILEDVSAVYLQIVVPADMSSGLPQVMQDWGNFWGDPRDRIEKVQEFIDAFRKTSKPGLFFFHCDLPHGPWVSFPSAEKLPRLRQLIVNNRYVPDNEKEKDYEDHLLQVCFVDELLAKMLARLKSVGLYDQSLIIITSDHGVSMVPGTSAREVTSSDFTQILLVPLMIKLPDEVEGVVTDSNAETIDILPTIAKVLGTSAPWSDGQALIPVDGPERNKKMFFDSGVFREFKPQMFNLIRK